jgi:hypothetical protein
MHIAPIIRAMTLIIRYWRVISGMANITIALIAAAAWSGILKPHTHLLAFLIAWANICAGIHRLTDDRQSMSEN